MNNSCKTLRIQGIKQKSTKIPQDFNFALLFTKKKIVKGYIHPGLRTSTVEYIIHDPGKIHMCALSAEAIDFKTTATSNKHCILNLVC